MLIGENENTLLVSESVTDKFIPRSIIDSELKLVNAVFVTRQRILIFGHSTHNRNWKMTNWMYCQENVESSVIDSNTNFFALLPYVTN